MAKCWGPHQPQSLILWPLSSEWAQYKVEEGRGSRGCAAVRFCLRLPVSGHPGRGLARPPSPLPKALPRPQLLTLLQGDEHAARQPALLGPPGAALKILRPFNKLLLSKISTALAKRGHRPPPSPHSLPSILVTKAEKAPVHSLTSFTGGHLYQPWLATLKRW